MCLSDPRAAPAYSATGTGLKPSETVHVLTRTTAGLPVSFLNQEDGSLDVTQQEERPAKFLVESRILRPRASF